MKALYNEPSQTSSRKLGKFRKLQYASGSHMLSPIDILTNWRDIEPRVEYQLKKFFLYSKINLSHGLIWFQRGEWTSFFRNSTHIQSN